jgi:hypothetical protein
MILNWDYPKKGFVHFQMLYFDYDAHEKIRFVRSFGLVPDPGGLRFSGK